MPQTCLGPEGKTVGVVTAPLWSLGQTEREFALSASLSGAQGLVPKGAEASSTPFNVDIEGASAPSCMPPSCRVAQQDAENNVPASVTFARTSTPSGPSHPGTGENLEISQESGRICPGHLLFIPRSLE